MIRDAAKAGFQCVFVSMRTTNGVTVKSGKSYGLNSWEDVKEPTEFIYAKYCKPFGQRIYMYGVSLGGTICGNYLIEDDANHPLSGAALYGAPFNCPMTIGGFKTRCFGLYDKVLGMKTKM